MRVSSLPVEVLSLVASHLEDPIDLFALSQTCRRIREVVCMLLYSFVTMGKAQDNDRLAQILADHPELCNHIRQVHVDDWYAFGHEVDDDDDREDAHHFSLPLLSSLLGLYVSTGKEAVVLAGYIERAVELDQLSLLQTCTLSFSGHGLDFLPADFENYWKVFLLPSLETLTVFNATLDNWTTRRPGRAKRYANNMKLIQLHQKCTSLKCLRLWDCEIDLATLGQLLKLPRQLDELVIHGTAPSLSEALRTPMTADTVTAALAPVARTLRRLTFLQDTVDEPVPFHCMPALERLRVHPHPFFGVLDETTAESLRATMPPALNELVLTGCRFSGAHWMLEDTWIFLAAWLGKQGSKRRPKKIRVHLNDHQPVPDRIVRAFEESGVHLEVGEHYSMVRSEWRQSCRDYFDAAAHRVSQKSNMDEFNQLARNMRKHINAPHLTRVVKTIVDRDLLVTEFTMLRPNPVFEWSNITVVVDTGDTLDRQIGPSPLPHLPPLSYGLALDFKAGWWHWDDFTKNANELYMQTLVKCSLTFEKYYDGPYGLFNQWAVFAVKSILTIEIDQRAHRCPCDPDPFSLNKHINVDEIKGQTALQTLRVMGVDVFTLGRVLQIPKALKVLSLGYLGCLGEAPLSLFMANGDLLLANFFEPVLNTLEELTFHHHSCFGFPWAMFTKLKTLNVHVDHIFPSNKKDIYALDGLIPATLVHLTIWDCRFNDLRKGKSKKLPVALERLADECSKGKSFSLRTLNLLMDKEFPASAELREKLSEKYKAAGVSLTFED